MQPELRETLTNLASNREFTKELVNLIQEKLNQKSKLLLEKTSLPVKSEEGKTLTEMSENAGASQSIVESYSISQAGGRVINDPADKEELRQAYDVLKRTVQLFGFSNEIDGGNLEENILKMIFMLQNKSMNVWTRIFGHDMMVLPFSINKDFLLSYCKINRYIFVSNKETFTIRKRSQLRINLDLFVNYVGHISKKLAEISGIEIFSPLLFNSLMYSVKFMDMTNFSDKDVTIPKDSKLVKLNLHKEASEILFLRLPAMQMERSWNGLESFEYDVDRTAFLHRLTAGVAKVLQ